MKATRWKALTVDRITDRYHVLGSRGDASLFTMLEPASKSQRLFHLVIVGIGPPGGQVPGDVGGVLDGGQRVLPPARSARLADTLFGELARSDRIPSGWVLVGRTPRSNAR